MRDFTNLVCTMKSIRKINNISLLTIKTQISKTFLINTILTRRNINIIYEKQKLFKYFQCYLNIYKLLHAGNKFKIF